MRYVYLGENVDTSPMKDISYDGLTASIKGFNIYYIFNHNRFSYPAAFSQSTVQRRSCGSPMVGIGYTKHTLSVDWKKLNSVISAVLGSEIADSYVDKNVISGKINIQMSLYPADTDTTGCLQRTGFSRHPCLWHWDISTQQAMWIIRTFLSGISP